MFGSKKRKADLAGREMYVWVADRSFENDFGRL